MKTVCPKGTGVRIPLPAPNKRTTEPTKLGCFFVSLAPVREDSNAPLRLSESQNGVRIPYPKIEELALQAQGGIFTFGEYPYSKLNHHSHRYICKTILNQDEKYVIINYIKLYGGNYV